MNVYIYIYLDVKLSEDKIECIYIFVDVKLSEDYGFDVILERKTNVYSKNDRNRPA